jgi:hypothetical protein
VGVKAMWFVANMARLGGQVTLRARPGQ